MPVTMQSGLESRVDVDSMRIVPFDCFTTKPWDHMWKLARVTLTPMLVFVVGHVIIYLSHLKSTPKSRIYACNRFYTYFVRFVLLVVS